MRKFIFLYLLICSILCADSIVVPEGYYSILERLIFYKDDLFKVFYGGPIISDHGAKWVMNAMFEDEKKNTRAVYEISFINCDPHHDILNEIPIFLLQVSDIDIKFKNESSDSYKLFSSFIDNNDPAKKGILIREVDVSNIYFPEMFIASIYSDFRESDKEVIRHFLSSKFHCNGTLVELNTSNRHFKRQTKKEYKGLLEHKKVVITIDEKPCDFYISHYFFKNDVWKSYYVVSVSPDFPNNTSRQEEVLLRLDSGCMSGQIYNDGGCDCLDQLHHALGLLAKSKDQKGVLIHIPTHDGRGFGSAPKAETEIYKNGGKGRINTTEPLDTIQAAILLYNTAHFDIRTFDGCARLLTENNIHNVALFTDNKSKVGDLKNGGLMVSRKSTNTHKVTCEDHIKAKKSSPLYFGD